MGCFDESCCMSNIPIHYNDDVVQIYVTGIDNETCQGNMYFDPVWTPISLPIFGKYNDYGDVEPYDNDPGYRFLSGPLMDIFKSVTPKLFSTEAGLASFLRSTHSRVQPLPDGINSLTKNEYEIIQRQNGSEYSQLNKSNGTRVVKVFIHREIWNNILSLAPVKYEKNISDFIKWRRLDKSLLERIKANDSTVYDSDELKDSPILKELSEEPEVDVILIASLFKSMNHINPIPEFFFNAHGLNRCKALNRVITRHIIDEVDDFISTPTTESTNRVNELLTGMIDLCSFYHGSAILNKAIAPVCHRASQYQEKREMQATIKFLNVAKKLQSNKLKAYILGSDE